jgi:uncharacterized protein (DUF169 family)
LGDLERIEHMSVSREIMTIQTNAKRMISLLGLNHEPVGVSLVSVDNSNVTAYPAGQRLQHHRYCQALMRARHGESVGLDATGIACPAAAAAFGFRPLPEGLTSGRGLVGFGIVSDPQVGRAMFAGMTTLAPGSVSRLELFPLSEAVFYPDVIVVEDEVEKLMWINLAYLHSQTGQRIASSTAVLQATCVDSTIIPFIEKRLNFSFGCYGCRDATDMALGEGISGFPAELLPAILEHLEYLAEKAIPTSRGKKAFKNLAIS